MSGRETVGYAVRCFSRCCYAHGYDAQGYASTAGTRQSAAVWADRGGAKAWIKARRVMVGSGDTFWRICRVTRTLATARKGAT